MAAPGTEPVAPSLPAGDVAPAPAPVDATLPAPTPAAPAAPAQIYAGPGQATANANDGLLAQRLMLGGQSLRCEHKARADGSIVVCGGREDSESQRLPLRDQSEAAKSTNTGVPAAPNVFGIGPCTGLCLKGGYAPPPVYYIDIAALPAAPEGSDADKIAKGEVRAH